MVIFRLRVNIYESKICMPFAHVPQKSLHFQICRTAYRCAGGNCNGCCNSYKLIDSFTFCECILQRQPCSAHLSTNKAFIPSGSECCICMHAFIYTVQAYFITNDYLSIACDADAYGRNGASAHYYLCYVRQ